MNEDKAARQQETCHEQGHFSDPQIYYSVTIRKNGNQ
jgi:hypothetical protein